MRYSRMAGKPPKRKRKFANIIIVVVILGIAAYLIGAGAAGSWLAENVINPVFNNGNSSAATPSASPQATADNTSTPLPVDLPGASGSRAEEEITAEEVSLFALQTGAFSEESNAKSAAGEIQNLGGAGYVAYDGDLYRVLIAGYTKESDALDVKTQLNEQSVETSVFNLKSGSLSFKIGAEQSQIDAVKACFDAVPETVESLQQIIFDADNAKNVDQQITLLQQKVSASYDTFDNAVPSEETAILSFKSYMKSLSDSVSALPLSTSVSAAKFSSDLKYTLISIVVDYSSFLDEINK